MGWWGGDVGPGCLPLANCPFLAVTASLPKEGGNWLALGSSGDPEESSLAPLGPYQSNYGGMYRLKPHFVGCPYLWTVVQVVLLGGTLWRPLDLMPDSL